MECYLDVPVLCELIKVVSSNGTDVKAVHTMTSAIISYYLPVDEGYIISTEQNQPTDDPNSIILTVQRFLPDNQGLQDHMIIEMRPNLGNGLPSLDRLLNALAMANTERGNCWAILVIGPMMVIFEYRSGMVSPWKPAGCEDKDHHDLRSDIMTIDWFFKRTAQRG